MSVNKALKLLRTYHQLKQVELAKRLGVSNSYLSEIESGSKTPGLDLVSKYAEVFKMPASSILLFSEKIDANSGPSEKIRVAAASKILRLLEWIDEKDSMNDG